MLDTPVIRAEVTENLPILEWLFRARFCRSLRPCLVTGESVLRLSCAATWCR
jgi:hypothetical protein